MANKMRDPGQVTIKPLISEQMNTKTETQLKTLINQRIKLKKNIYADSHGESKEDVLEALDRLIEKRTLELRKIA